MGRLTIWAGVALSLLVFSASLLWPGTPAMVRADDDHGDFRFAATPLNLGAGGIAGAIQETSVDVDVDYFAFSARRGARYSIVLELLTIQDADFSVINAVARGPGSSPGQIKSQQVNQKRIQWIARTTDTYFIEVYGIQNGPQSSPPLGSYKLTVNADTSLEDRHSDDRNGATSIVVGNLYQGAISPWTNQPGYAETAHGGDDWDVFFFHADRGVKYAIKADLGTSEGVAIAVEQLTGAREAFNDGIGSSLAWTAPTSGTYFIVVTGSNRVREPVGTYVLKVEGDTSLQDRHSDSSQSASPISFGNANQGAVSPADDVDYFSVQARRGVKYSFLVEFGTVQEVEISVRDPQGNTRLSTAGVGNTLEWIANTNGTLYVAVAASPQMRDPTGTYALTVNADTALQDRHGDVREDASPITFGTQYQGAISPKGDYDHFSFQASRGTRYSIDIEPGAAQAVSVLVAGPAGDTLAFAGSASGPIHWIAPSDDTYFIIVSASLGMEEAIGTYTLVLGSDILLEDRHSDIRERATPLGLGTLYRGAISPATDQDKFSFAATRGVRYSIALEPGTAPGVAVSVIGPSGASLESNDGSGNGLLWTAPTDEVYFIAVSASPRVEDPVGTYGLLVNSDTSLVDRHSDTTDQPTPITLGTLYQAAVSPEDDIDYFSLSGKRGVKYTFELTYGTAEAVSLSVGRAGSMVGTGARNYGERTGVEWIAPDSDTYLIAVSRSYKVPDPVGTYSLRVGGDGTLEDRHGDSSTTATLISLGTLFQGAISPHDDYDYFSFSAEAGTEYLVQVELGTAQAVRFWVTNSSAGFTDSNYGVGTSLRWTAPTTGTYTLAVSGSAQALDSGGTYRIGIITSEGSPLTPASAAPANTPVPTPPPAPMRAEISLSVASRIAPAGGTVRIPILVDLADEISRLDFNLSYDPAVAEATNVILGSLLSAATLTTNIDALGVVSFEIISQEGVSGEGSVAIVEFRVVGDQGIPSLLNLSEALVIDAAGVTQPVRLAGGVLTVERRTTGDGDGDGRITSFDALLALRMSAQLAEEDLVMDVDGDGRVTAQDARRILAMAAAPWEN